MKNLQKQSLTETLHIAIEPVSDGKFHNIYFIYSPISKNEKIQSGVASVQFNAK